MFRGKRRRPRPWEKTTNTKEEEGLEISCGGGQAALEQDQKSPSGKLYWLNNLLGGEGSGALSWRLGTCTVKQQAKKNSPKRNTVRTKISSPLSLRGNKREGEKRDGGGLRHGGGLQHFSFLTPREGILDTGPARKRT